VAPAAEKLTIAVPCLNEERSITDTVADIYAMIDRLDMPAEVILVDDASTDSTLDVMRGLAREYPGCHVKANSRNLGAGRSVIQLWNEIDPDSWFSALPGDNEIVAASLLNHARLRHDADIVLGYLHNPVIRPMHRRLASTAFTALVQSAYGLPHRYFNGPKMYRVRTFAGLDVEGGGHAFNAEILAKAVLRDPGLRIAEAPFVARGRSRGTTKAFTPRYIRGAVMDFVRGYQSVAEHRTRAETVETIAPPPPSTGV
jgi:glycosyltransferase involved in cell wall biosynthesis